MKRLAARSPLQPLRQHPESSPGDLFAAPLDGGEPRAIACHVFGVDQLLADADALYYRSWVGDVIGAVRTSP